MSRASAPEACRLPVTGTSAVRSPAGLSTRLRTLPWPPSLRHSVDGLLRDRPAPRSVGSPISFCAARFHSGTSLSKKRVHLYRAMARVSTRRRCDQKGSAIRTLRWPGTASKRPTVLHLCDLRPVSCGDCHSLFDVPGDRSTAPTPLASASQSPMPSPADARTPRTIPRYPAARCSASPRSLPIDADRLPLHQTRSRQPFQQRENRHVRFHVDQTYSVEWFGGASVSRSISDPRPATQSPAPSK